MEAQRFKSILTTFADKPADVDLARGTLLVQIREELIGASITSRHGSLHVIENDTMFPAATWIIERIARLQLLADRILTHVPSEPHFVNPTAELLDQLEYAPNDREIHIDEAGDCAIDVLNRRPAGTSSVLYLTSDAGEGKTTLIQHLARLQAGRYKRKETDWLIVPVSLGGRTFMRFDDVVIGALVNNLRFFVYYEAFIELVKMGAIVPALDGFEEMFVENAAGDAISALGNLMDTLSSAGSILIAARKAYFEYKSLQAQARLFDSIGGQSVAFARLALNRWNRRQFVTYAEQRGVQDAGDIFDDVATKLQPDHPLLTRAVLVKRLLDVAADSPDREQLLAKIEADPKDFFRQFVGSIIAREAHEKWIDKSGEPAMPLLTEDEHYELLSCIALEMWTSNAEFVRSDVLDFAAEMFADSKRKSKVITAQIVERVKQHALIVKADSQSEHFCFDHQEFYHFFLGEAVGRTIVDANAPAIRHAFRQGTFPNLTVDTAARYAMRHGTTPSEVIETVNQICETEPRASFVKDNLSALVMRLIDYAGAEEVSVRYASFPIDSLCSRRISGVIFNECYFQSTSLENSSLIRVRFERCEFEQIDVVAPTVIDRVTLHDCACSSVVASSDTAVFAPDQVEHILRNAGFSISRTVQREAEPAVEIDEHLLITERMCRAFLRSTGINENTLKQRLGDQATTFFADVLPQLMQNAVINEVPFRGAGRQRRFRLGVSLHEIQGAIERANGSFERFLRTFDD